MYYMTLGVLALCIPGLWALFRAEGEIRDRGGIRPLTFVAAYAAFTAHGLATALASATGSLPTSFPLPQAWIFGGVLAALGIFVNLAGRLGFRSFRLMWGLDTDRLVTSGIYGLSRNPQCLGWLLIYLGMAIASGSGAALALSAVFLLSLWIWLPFEERILADRFGAAYLAYQRAVPRLIGFRWDRWRRRAGSEHLAGPGTALPDPTY